MRRLLFTGVAIIGSILFAQARSGSPENDFKGSFFNSKYRINLVIDLENESVVVPGLSFLGQTHGYMGGNIYGVWMITSCKVKKDEATIRMSNDQGADAQTVRLTSTDDGGLDYQVVGDNEVKRIEGRKLVKIPATLHFERK